MRKLIEVDNEGLDSLIGDTVTFFCLNYIYTGKLIGVNDKFVLLENPKIVYETGPFENKDWTDAQSLPHNLYLMLATVESFGIMK
jgi:hypothetical protein